MAVLDIVGLGFELDGEDHPGLAYFKHGRMAGKWRGQRRHALGCVAVAWQHRIAVENRQRSQRCRTGQRIAAVTVRMQEGTLARIIQKSVVNLLGGQHRAQWQETTGQAFGQA